MSAKMARKNEHLQLNHSQILARSLVAGALGVVPIPWLDEWLPSVVQRTTLRRIAETRRVDADGDALRVIADGKIGTPTWRTAAAAAPISPVLRQGWRRVFRRMMFGLIAYRRAEAAGHLFSVATMFDHYCARLHVGQGLDLAAGKALRRRMDDALGQMPRGLLATMFRGSIGAAGRAALVVPVELGHRLTGGRFRKRALVDENQAEEIVEGAVNRLTGGVLGQVARKLERELGDVGQRYLDNLIEAFEKTEE
jgi:hypothetical protein